MAQRPVNQPDRRPPPPPPPPRPPTTRPVRHPPLPIDARLPADQAQIQPQQTDRLSLRNRNEFGGHYEADSVHQAVHRQEYNVHGPQFNILVETNRREFSSEDVLTSASEANANTLRLIEELSRSVLSQLSRESAAGQLLSGHPVQGNIHNAHSPALPSPLGPGAHNLPVRQGSNNEISQPLESLDRDFQNSVVNNNSQPDSGTHERQRRLFPHFPSNQRLSEPYYDQNPGERQAQQGKPVSSGSTSPDLSTAMATTNQNTHETSPNIPSAQPLEGDRRPRMDRYQSSLSSPDRSSTRLPSFENTSYASQSHHNRQRGPVNLSQGEDSGETPQSVPFSPHFERQHPPPRSRPPIPGQNEISNNSEAQSVPQSQGILERRHVATSSTSSEARELYQPSTSSGPTSPSSEASISRESVQRKRNDINILKKAEKRQWEAVRELLDQGVNINTQQKRGLTVLHLAALQGNLDQVTFLLSRGADKTIICSKYGTLLELACYKGHEAIVDYLMSDNPQPYLGGSDSPMSSPLQAAIHGARDAIALKLLERGADVNIKGGLHHTIVQAAIKCKASVDVCRRINAAGPNLDQVRLEYRLKWRSIVRHQGW